MSAHDEGRRAIDLLELHLEEVPRRGLERIRALAHVAISTAVSDFLGAPSVGDYVVRRRSDGAEILRVDAEWGEQTGQLRAHLDAQLHELSPSEFADAWGLDPTSPEG